MPKDLNIDPKAVRKPGFLKTTRIPLNQYKTGFQAELDRYGKKILCRILEDMCLIREFEICLNEIKTHGKYHEMNHIT